MYCVTDVLNRELCLLFYNRHNFLNCCVRGFGNISIVKHTTIQIPIPKPLNKSTVKTYVFLFKTASYFTNASWQLEARSKYLEMAHFTCFLKNSKVVYIIKGSAGRNMYTKSTLEHNFFFNVLVLMWKNYSIFVLMLGL